MSPAARAAVKTMDDAFEAILKADTNADNIIPAFRRNAPLQPGPALVPVKRYTSRAYHEREKERLWSRVWQMAAHEDDFPNVGDVVPYDIVDKSFVIVRVADDEYKAYYNACLHRGRKLRESRGKSLTELRCPFHGWTWNLDGSLKVVPCAHDYNGLNKEDEALPEVQVGRWGRFIFINPDPEAAPLEDHVGDLASNFEFLPFERRYKSAHVAKVIRANWKVVQEAFMESYHVLMTHPQILTGGANDLCTKYDAFQNYSRAIRCGALEADPMPDWDDLPQDGISRLRHPLTGWIYEDQGDGKVKVTTPRGDSGLFTAFAEWIEGDLKDANPHLCLWVSGEQLKEVRRVNPAENADLMVKAAEKLGEGASAMAINAEMQRQALKAILPEMAESIPDVELFSSIFFTLFPNWHPWGSFNPINYRFRPNGDNHEECIMECMYLTPIPEDGNYEPVREIHWLGADDDWTEAPELGMLAMIFNQDMRNLPYVYDGMKATAREHLRFADYNELKLRHWHQLYGEWVGDE